MGLLGLRQGLEPVGDLVEALVARGARHAGIHVGVFVGLAGHRRHQIVARDPDRLAGGGIAGLDEEVEMAVGVAGLALGGRAEERRNVVMTLYIGLAGEVEIAPVGL